MTGILIGKSRRITLDELRTVADHGALLEMVHDGQEVDASNQSVAGEELVASLRNLTLSDDALSPSVTRAALTLLALTLSQGNCIETVLAAKVVEVVNTHVEVRLSGDVEEFVTGLAGIVGEGDHSLLMEKDGKVKDFVGRVIGLARVACSLSLAKSLSTNTADAIASLSYERLSTTPNGSSIMTTESFSSTTFDELRPHRGCVESAAVLRAVLQGSKIYNSVKHTSAAANVEVEDAIRYTLTTPQYHGPSRESIAAAAKTIELEMNCYPIGSKMWDDTVAIIATESCLRGVESLLLGSIKRSGGNVELDKCGGTLLEVAKALENSTDKLKQALEHEASIGCSFITNELTKMEADLKAKEIEKAKRAAARTNEPAGENKEDEFAGMSEGQKAKILKKRAEKEAKAAAKRKAKEEKAAGGEAALSSLFGVGIALIYPIMTSGDGMLSEATVSQLDKSIESLLSGGMQRKPKVPKGTRDYLPEQMAIRDEAFTIIRRVFKRHGAVEIDTPVFELKETLTGKYGEDSKLIYDLADQGGERLALRYDLTVPFARFLAVNAVGNIKRFHIGKVYRRDQPALSRGRYREFYQCDFDIAGVYGRMVPDSECLAVACEILDALPIGDFGIKLNHRRLLDAILDICGVPAEKFRTICSAVDKLDKEPWDEVRREMVEDKGLSGDVADKIGKFVVLKGKPWDMYNSLMMEKKFGDHQGAMEAMEDMRILFEYLEAMDKLHFISFDLSLARGLDYYTGVIYEAVCMNGNTQVGSIGGGGRYDYLVSMFQEAGKVTPTVGVSVGIERVFTLMEERLQKEQGGSIKQPNVSVLVASAGGENQLQHRMKLANLLWAANISAEFNQQENPKLKFEITNALERGIPFMVIVGEEEAKENRCKVKDLNARTEETVDVSNLVALLKEKGVIPVGCEFAMDLLKQEKA